MDFVRARLEFVDEWWIPDRESHSVARGEEPPYQVSEADLATGPLLPTDEAATDGAHDRTNGCPDETKRGA